MTRGLFRLFAKGRGVRVFRGLAMSILLALLFTATACSQ